MILFMFLLSSSDVWPPSCNGYDNRDIYGMDFKTDDDALKYYQDFGKSHGFNVRK